MLICDQRLNKLKQHNHKVSVIMRFLAIALFSLGTAISFTAHADSSPITPPAVDEDALAERARSITQQYAGALKKTLQATIMTSGPASAIHTCKVHAPGISAQTAQLTGWEVSRTSDKLRNPNNQPDLWETNVLKTFKEKASKGAPIKNLEHYAVVMNNGKPVFRYMKAIPVQSVCLNCHGTRVGGPVKNAIDNLFPTDRATGYREGDLRGAFTLKRAL